MGRTILRSANTSEVTDISESFANFASYTGINEDKSFVGTDQNSFEESNNMYVDVNGQLSTRPPVEKHTISVVEDGYDVVDIFKVNGITFYKIYKTYNIDVSSEDLTSGTYTATFTISTVLNYDVVFTLHIVGLDDYEWDAEYTISAGSTSITVEMLDVADVTITSSTYIIYYITWKYNGDWSQVVGDYNVKYVQGYYIFYDENTLIAYKYNGESWTEYSLEDIIYIPTTEVRSGSTIQEGESKNVLTTAYIVTYLLEPGNGIITDTSDLIGKTVTIAIDDTEEVTLTWTVTTDIILSKTYGVISSTVTTIIACTPSTDYTLLVAYDGHWTITYNGNTIPGCYYSVDGNLWTPIVFPDDCSNYTFNACLSEQSNYLWIQCANMDSNYTMKLYYYVLPYTLISTSAYLTYNVLTYTAFEPYGYNAGIYDSDNSEYISESIFINNFALNTSFMPLMHSVNANQCILLMKGDLSYDVYYNTSTTFSYNTSSYSSSDSGTKSSQGNLIIVNNLSVSTYCGGDIYDISSTSGANTSMIRFYPTSDSIQYANIYYRYTNSYQSGSGTYLCIMPIAMDENYVPYYHFVNDITGLGIGKTVFDNVYVSNMHIGLTNNNYNTYIMLDMDSNFTSLDNIDTWEHTKDGIISYHIAFALSGTNNVAFFNEGYTTGDFYVSVTATYTTVSEYDSNYVTLTSSDSNGYTIYYYYYTSSTMYNINSVRSSPNFTTSTWTYAIIQLRSTSDVSSYFRIYKSASDDEGFRVLTDKYYYVNSTMYEYMDKEDVASDSYIPIAIITRVSSADNETTLYYFYYWSTNKTDNGYVIYTNNWDTALINYLVTNTNDNTITDKDYNYLSMDFTAELLTTTIASGNYLYQASGTEDDKLYIPEDSKVELPDNVTGLIEFSQTVLGVFLPYTAYEYTVSSSDDGSAYYYLYPTKLVIGNRSGYDLLQSYDGSSIYISTVKGIATLTYEELVQSTEHVFTYLTDNILGAYKEFDTSAIKFCQYLNWLFMYRQDSNICYLYDISNSAWWMWTLPDNITKIYWDTENDVLIVLMSSTLYYFNFDTDDFYDYGTEVINWNFKSQKLHLSAPNNYKHVRRVSIVTTQNTDKMRYKLKFTNYKSWERLQDKYVVEYDIDNLNTLIQKVNFMKCNAFQFEISNDTTWKYPQKFVVSNIAIKYRITEDIR